MTWWKKIGQKLLKQGKSDNKIYIRCFADAGLEYDKDLIDRKKSVEENVKTILKKTKIKKSSTKRKVENND